MDFIFLAGTFSLENGVSDDKGCFYFLCVAKTLNSQLLFAFPRKRF